jgi:large subunit ribosomal protein L13
MSKQRTIFYTKENDNVNRLWRVYDAEGEILGRLATKIAQALRGKDKAEFTPNQDCGDFVVVINAEKIKVTGNKEDQKFYYRHSGYCGGFRQESLRNLKARRPEEIIRKAVKGMLPHNRLSDRLITKLKIYKGSSHPHSAQVELVGSDS